MNQERIQNKIRKLLRLAESDNPYEAERAKSQAKALMRQHQIDSDELEIIEAEGNSFPRKKYKAYENLIISALEDISGCKAILYSKPVQKRGRTFWNTHPVFLGPQAEAEISAYTWDVILQQLNEYRKKIQREHKHLKTAEQDIMLLGWAEAASDKITDLFPQKERHQATLSKAEKMDLKTVPPRQIQIDDDQIHLTDTGYTEGINVNLHIATTNQSAQPMELPCQTTLSK